MTTYPWFEFYTAAVLETDWSKMEERLGTAEAAMKSRLQELNLDHGGTLEERQALVDSMNKLAVLRADAVTWRVSESAS